WTATSDRRASRARSSLLLGRFLEHLPRLLDVLERDLAGLDQVRHQRLRAAAEEIEQIVDEPALRGVARHQGLAYVSTADLLRAPHGPLGLQAVHERLHGGVCGPGRLGQLLLDLADRRGAVGPEGFHDLELRAAQLRNFHDVYSTTLVGEVTT